VSINHVQQQLSDESDRKHLRLRAAQGVDKVVENVDALLQLSGSSVERWPHLSHRSPIERIFAAECLRANGTKGPTHEPLAEHPTAPL
jgi:hypothetical protein